MTAVSALTPIVITHESGLRFGAQVRSHHIVVDQPKNAGGGDAGPMPLEMLGVSLGTCVALYVQQFCHARKLPYEGMRVEVEQHGASNPARIAEFVVRVILPTELSDQQMVMLERAARSCPAHHTLEAGAKISIEFQMPVTATV